MATRGATPLLLERALGPDLPPLDADRCSSRIRLRRNCSEGQLRGRPGWAAVLSSTAVREDRFFWEISVTASRSNACGVAVGVCPAEAPASSLNDCLVEGGFALLADGSMHHGTALVGTAPGIRISPGDTVGVLIDLMGRTLSFSVNGKALEQAFLSVPLRAYRLRVALFDLGSAVRVRETGYGSSVDSFFLEPPEELPDPTLPVPRLTLLSASASAVRVGWDARLSGHSQAATECHVEWRPHNASRWQSKSLAMSEEGELEVRGLLADTSYEWRARTGTDAAHGGWSRVVLATTRRHPNALSAPVACLCSGPDPQLGGLSAQSRRLALARLPPLLLAVEQGMAIASLTWWMAGLGLTARYAGSVFAFERVLFVVGLRLFCGARLETMLRPPVAALLAGLLWVAAAAFFCGISTEVLPAIEVDGFSKLVGCRALMGVMAGAVTHSCALVTRNVNPKDRAVGTGLGIMAFGALADWRRAYLALPVLVVLSLALLLLLVPLRPRPRPPPHTTRAERFQHRPSVDLILSGGSKVLPGRPNRDSQALRAARSALRNPLFVLCCAWLAMLLLALGGLETWGLPAARDDKFALRDRQETTVAVGACLALAAWMGGSLARPLSDTLVASAAGRRHALFRLQLLKAAAFSLGGAVLVAAAWHQATQPATFLALLSSGAALLHAAAAAPTTVVVRYLPPPLRESGIEAFTLLTVLFGSGLASAGMGYLLDEGWAWQRLLRDVAGGGAALAGLAGLWVAARSWRKSACVAAKCAVCTNNHVPLFRPGIPQNVRFVDRGIQTLTVGWEAPEKNGGLPILTYEVRLCSEFATEVLKRLPMARTSTTQTFELLALELLPAAYYRCQARAENALGWGNWSDLSLPAAVPGVPLPALLDAPNKEGRSERASLASSGSDKSAASSTGEGSQQGSPRGRGGGMKIPPPAAPEVRPGYSTCSTALLHLDANTAVSCKCELRWRHQSSDKWMSAIADRVTDGTISWEMVNLFPGDRYEYQARTSCGSGFGPWSEPVVIVQQPVRLPDGVLAEPVMSLTATLPSLDTSKHPEFWARVVLGSTAVITLALYAELGSTTARGALWEARFALEGWEWAGTWLAWHAGAYGGRAVALAGRLSRWLSVRAIVFVLVGFWASVVLSLGTDSRLPSETPDPIPTMVVGRKTLWAARMVLGGAAGIAEHASSQALRGARSQRTSSVLQPALRRVGFAAGVACYALGYSWALTVSVGAAVCASVLLLPAPVKEPMHPDRSTHVSRFVRNIKAVDDHSAATVGVGRPAARRQKRQQTSAGRAARARAFALLAQPMFLLPVVWSTLCVAAVSAVEFWAAPAMQQVLFPGLEAKWVMGVLGGSFLVAAAAGGSMGHVIAASLVESAELRRHDRFRAVIVVSVALTALGALLIAGAWDRGASVSISVFAAYLTAGLALLHASVAAPSAMVQRYLEPVNWLSGLEAYRIVVVGIGVCGGPVAIAYGADLWKGGDLVEALRDGAGGVAALAAVVALWTWADLHNRRICATQQCAVCSRNHAPVFRPGAPSSARFLERSSESIKIAWEAPERNGGRPITFYQVRATTDTGFSHDRAVAVDLTAEEDEDVFELQLHDLVADKSYRFSVRARTAVGWSDWSVRSKPMRTGALPLTAEELEAVGGEALQKRHVSLLPSPALPKPIDQSLDAPDLRALHVGTTTLVVSWTPPEMSGVWAHELQWRPGDAALWAGCQLRQDCDMALESLEAALSYELRVRRLTLAGRGPWSETLTVVTRGYADVLCSEVACLAVGHMPEQRGLLSFACGPVVVAALAVTGAAVFAIEDGFALASLPSWGEGGGLLGLVVSVNRAMLLLGRHVACSRWFESRLRPPTVAALGAILWLAGGIAFGWLDPHSYTLAGGRALMGLGGGIVSHSCALSLDALRPGALSGLLFAQRAGLGVGVAAFGVASEVYDGDWRRPYLLLLMAGAGSVLGLLWTPVSTRYSPSSKANKSSGAGRAKVQRDSVVLLPGCSLQEPKGLGRPAAALGDGAATDEDLLAAPEHYAGHEHTRAEKRRASIASVLRRGVSAPARRRYAVASAKPSVLRSTATVWFAAASFVLAVAEVWALPAVLEARPGDDASEVAVVVGVGLAVGGVVGTRLGRAAGKHLLLAADAKDHPAFRRRLTTMGVWVGALLFCLWGAAWQLLDSFHVFTLFGLWIASVATASAAVIVPHAVVARSLAPSVRHQGIELYRLAAGLLGGVAAPVAVGALSEYGGFGLVALLRNVALGGLAIVACAVVLRRYVHRASACADKQCAVCSHYHAPVFLPAEPQPATMLRGSNTALVIRWMQPRRTGGLKLRRYRVRYMCTHSGILEKEFPVANAYEQKVTTTLDGLEPAQTYRVRIKVANDLGWGPYSELSEPMHTVDKPAPAPPVIFSDILVDDWRGSAVVHWAWPPDNGAEIDSFHVHVTPENAPEASSVISIPTSSSAVPGSAISSFGGSVTGSRPGSSSLPPSRPGSSALLLPPPSGSPPPSASPTSQRSRSPKASSSPVGKGRKAEKADKNEGSKKKGSKKEGSKKEDKKQSKKKKKTSKKQELKGEEKGEEEVEEEEKEGDDWAAIDEGIGALDSQRPRPRSRPGTRESGEDEDEEQDPYMHAALANLEPGTVYSVSVSASNVFGVGPLSKPMRLFMPAVVPHAPEPPQRFEFSFKPNTIGLQWQPPAHGGGMVVTEYELQYRLSLANAATSTQAAREQEKIPWASLVKDVSASPDVKPIAQIVANLLPETLYEFKVRARSTIGWSAFSATSPPMKTAPGTVPAQVPLLSLLSISEANWRYAARLRWVVPEDGGSALQAFTAVGRRPHSTTGAMIDAAHAKYSPEGGWVQIGTLDRLYPGVTYSVRLFAVNQYGSSEASHSVEVTLPPLPPSPPLQVRQGAVSFTYVRLMWGWPDEDGGSAAQVFQLDCKDAEARGAEWRKLCEVDPVKREAAAGKQKQGGRGGKRGGKKNQPVRMVGMVAAQHQVDSLEPGHAYEFRVRLRNGVDWGDYSRVLKVTTTTGKAPGRCGGLLTMGVENQDVHLEWRPPLRNGGRVHTYLIQYRMVVAEPPPWRTACEVPAETEGLDDGCIERGVAENLNPGRSFQLCIVAINKYGKGEQSNHCTASVPPILPGAPGVPELLRGTATTLFIKWGRPLHDGGAPVVGYDVQLRRVIDGELQDWLPETHLEVDPDEAKRQRNLVGLRPCSIYQMRIRAVNSVGAGPYSEVSGNVETQVAPILDSKLWEKPAATTELERGLVSLEWVHLRWREPWTDGGTNISHFEVHVRPIGEEEEEEDWRIVHVSGQPDREQDAVDRLEVEAHKVQESEESEDGEDTDEIREPDAFLLPLPDAEDPDSWFSEAREEETEGEGTSRGSSRSSVRPGSGASSSNAASVALLKRLSNASAGSTHSETEERPPPRHRFARVGDLLEGREFQLKIRAINSVGVGKFSNLLRVHTVQGEPPVQVSLPRLSEREARGFSLRWTAPVSTGGDVVSYRVRYRVCLGPVGERELLPEHTEWPFSVEVPATRRVAPSATLHQLMPGRQYAVQVAGCNERYGYGAYSSALQVEVPPEQPDAPSNLWIEQKTQVWAEVAWTRAHDNGRPVSTYAVELRTKGQLEWTVVKERYRKLADDDNGYCVRLEGMYAGGEFEVRVRAKNSVGWSPYSVVMTVGTLQGQPPAAPPALSVVQRASRTFSAAWGVPESFGGKLIRYVVRCSGDVPSLTVPATSTACAVHDLQPGQEYEVTVAAVNRYGEGRECAPLRHRVPPVSAAPPAAPTVLSMRADSISVSWEPPKYDGGSPVETYEASARAKGGDWQLVAFTVQRDSTFGTLEKLEGGTEYELRVRAVTEAGAGSWSTVTATVLALPPVPPMRLRCDEHQRCAVMVSWTQGTGVSAPVTSYELQWLVNEVDEEWHAETYGATAREMHARIADLQHGRLVRVRVRGCNWFGASDWAPLLLIQFDCFAPSIPDPPLLESRSVSGLRVRWAPPSHDGGSPLVRYHLEVFFQGAWTTVLADLAPDELATEVPGLEPGCEYPVRVRAANGVAGWGEFSAPSQPFSTISSQLPTGPGELCVSPVSAEEPNSADISWTPSTAVGGAVLRYQVETRRVQAVETGEEIADDDWAALVDLVCPRSDVRESYRVSGLAFGFRHAIRVRAVAREGPGEPSRVVHVTVDPAVPEPVARAPSLLVCTHDSISVAWEEAANRGSQVVEYAVRCCSDTQEEEAVVAASSANEALFRDLGPGQQYDVTVRARNGVGWGEPSPALTVACLAHPKWLPRPPVDFSASCSQGMLTLTWTPGDAVGVPEVTEYRISRRPPRSRSWQPLATVSASVCKIPSYSGQGQHLFRIVAVNVNGESAPPTECVLQLGEDAPGRPWGVTSTRSGTDFIALYWMAPDGAVREYEVGVLSLDSGPEADWVMPYKNVKRLVTGQTETCFVANRLLPGNRYRFRVRARNEHGWGELSMPSGIEKTTGEAPGATPRVPVVLRARGSVVLQPGAIGSPSLSQASQFSLEGSQGPESPASPRRSPASPAGSVGGRRLTRQSMKGGSSAAGSRSRGSKVRPQ